MNQSPTVEESLAGLRIRSLRRSLGQNQQSFSESLGLAQGHLSKLERGEGPITDVIILRLVRRFKVNVLWLIGAIGSDQTPLFDPLDDYVLRADYEKLKRRYLNEIEKTLTPSQSAAA